MPARSLLGRSIGIRFALCVLAFCASPHQGASGALGLSGRILHLVDGAVALTPATDDRQVYHASLSQEQCRAYVAAFGENPGDQRAAGFCLERAAKESENVVVAIGMLPFSNREGVPIRIEQLGYDPAFQKLEHQRTTSFLVASEEEWAATVQLMVKNASRLTEAISVGFRTPDGPVCAEIRLLFHFPRPHNLEIGGLTYSLSVEAQRYLSITSVSSYPSKRKVLIVQEPHYEADRQFALFKGLQILFKDNPRMLMENRTAFLAEGWPIGQRISVGPLIEADADPSEDLIREVLNTHLIPGYIAWAWTSHRDIPIIGVEDEPLYRVSADVWASLQAGKDEGRGRLWPHTVAARNPTIAAALIAACGKYENPILFVGGKHLYFIEAEELLRLSEWQSLQSVVNPAVLALVREADHAGIAEILRARGIGYYFVSARGDTPPGSDMQKDDAGAYAALMRAQLGASSLPPFRAFGSRTDSVTVSPSVPAAAKAATEKKGQVGKGLSGNGGDGDGGKGRWMQRLLDGLKKALQRMREAGKAAWNLGVHKSITKWKNQMAERGWTPQQIDDAITNGRKLPASNNVNPGNSATRYVHPQTGRSVVVDDVTGEVLHVGGDGFKY